MSLEDLRRAGVLLPEEEWGRHSLETTADKPALALVGIAALASLGMMLAGAGRALTWIGAGLYLAVLVVFTWLSLRAVDAQLNRARANPRGGKSETRAR